MSSCHSPNQYEQEFMTGRNQSAVLLQDIILVISPSGWLDDVRNRKAGLSIAGSSFVYPQGCQGNTLVVESISIPGIDFQDSVKTFDSCRIPF
jgi:hypothetical protein